MPARTPPDRVLLPSEFEDAAADEVWPGVFENTGHLPDGTQILAYVYSCPPDHTGTRDDLAVVHEFDAKGQHRSLKLKRVGETASGPKANVILDAMLAPYQAAGWEPGDILVRPFLVEQAGFHFGFIFETMENDVDDEPSEYMLFVPFGFPFYPPYDSGVYDT